MKSLLFVVTVAACGGPSQQQIVEQPAATAPFPHTEAPPASTSDEDRHHLTQQFDDMQWTQDAYRQAEGAQRAKAPPPKKKEAAPPNPKKAPVEQAPMPKKKAPVEQAPTQ